MPDDTILDEAKAHVYGDRQAEYGHPADDHGRVTGAVSALLGEKLRVPLTAHDIELVLIVVKLSRFVNGYKRDTVVDIAGYAATMELTNARTPDPREAEHPTWIPTDPQPGADTACEPCDPPDSEVRMTFYDGLGGRYPCCWDAASRRYVPDNDPRR